MAIESSSDDRCHQLQEQIAVLQQQLQELSQIHDATLAVLHTNTSDNLTLVELNQQLNASAELYRQDLQMAEQVQRSLLYKTAPETANYDIAFYFRPLAKVSGDFYDFYIDDSLLRGCLVCDVSGHGISSGLYTVVAKPIFMDIFTSHPHMPLHEIAAQINATLKEQMKISDYYLTCAMLRFDAGLVEYISAAHPPVVLKRSQGCEALQAPSGPPLGMASLSGTFQTNSVRVESGDSLILFSDGLIQSTNRDHGVFSLNQVTATCQSLQGNAAQILQGIVSAHANFMRGEELNDDLTIVVVQKR